MSPVSQYWNRNVDNWKVAQHIESGSSAFFQEVERYRFEKLDYLEEVVRFDQYKGKKVLDVGCGLGTDLSRFASAGAEVTGIDIAPRAVELAQTNFSQRALDGQFELMDGEAMRFDDNTFDFVYCHTVLHFTPHPEKMVNEIYRVLKPGGSALMMAINRRSWLYFMHRVAGLKIDYMDAPVFHKLDPQQFDQVTSAFSEKRIALHRFPVKTEVHKGWKAFLYNTVFVGGYNALPQSMIGNTGYHMLAFGSKPETGSAS